MCAYVDTSIVNRCFSDFSILHAICNAHGDATSVRGSLQGSHKFLVFCSFHNVSFLIPVLCIASLCCVPLLSFCLLFLVHLGGVSCDNKLLEKIANAFIAR